MIQILSLIDWNEIGYNIIAGLYSTIARVYDIMLTVSGYNNPADRATDNYYISTSNVATTMYTLAGIFMLFKVTIAMINMLIDPDKINDRQAGAGKLLTRIITTLAMLLIFVPNGWIFSKNPDNLGILMRIENALLAKDGLIYNTIPKVDITNVNSESPNMKNEFFVDNVYAAPTKYDCYYVKVTTSNDQTVSRVGNEIGNQGVAAKSTTRISGVMHLTFISNSSGKRKLCKPNILGGTLAADCKYSYNSDSSSPYTTYKKTLAWSQLSNGWPSSYNCPNRIDGSEAKDDYGNNAKSWDDPNAHGWVGGWHSAESMKQAVSAKNDTVNIVGNDSKKVEKMRNLLGITAGANLMYGISDEAADFAQSAMSSFYQCTGSSEDCDAKRAQMLISPDGNKAVIDSLNEDPPSMTQDFMIAIIAGIGLFIWLVFLCVDVIIRRFKLILLEMIAPIPIISYSDPKDETFGKWGKMYVATYADLFLKLIAISFAIALLQQVRYAAVGSGLMIFFYIVAILVFAKMIPDMISNIFGIKMSSGTFKDVMGMGKKVLGVGAGAAIGGAVGAITGTGLGGRLSGFANGAFKGANSGVKGNVLGGAKAAAATNALKDQGLNWFDRVRYQGLGALGIDPNISERGALAQTEQALAQVENIQGHISNIDSSIDRTPEVAAFNREITNGVIKDPTGIKTKTFREAFATAYDSYDPVTQEGTKQLNFNDIKETSAFKDAVKNMDSEQKKAFEQEFQKDYDNLYGEGATLAVNHKAWGAGYKTAKSAWLNGIGLLRDDKETVAFINNMVKDGKITQGNADALLRGEYSIDTSYTTITGAVKGATFGPQGELKNDIARQKQELSFADKKVKTGK